MDCCSGDGGLASSAAAEPRDDEPDDAEPDDAAVHADVHEEPRTHAPGHAEPPHDGQQPRDGKVSLLVGVAI